ncbi:hypothetical protein [Pontibacillus salipaludis]|uniref:hypothetical protein n=1 Tax=Pontibacillus salipaludis TaxID=1697394 RepID=UPI0031E75751
MSKNKKRMVYLAVVSFLIIGVVMLGNRLSSYNELLHRSYIDEVENNFGSIERYTELLSEAAKGSKSKEDLIVASWRLQRIESDLLDQHDDLLMSGLYKDKYHLGLDHISDKLDAISKSLKDASSYSLDDLPSDISEELKSQSAYLSTIMSKLHYNDLTINEIKKLFQAVENEMSEPADWQYNENR